MLPPPDVLLFDLDGTLVDSVGDITASANHVLTHFRLPTLEEEVVRTYVGDGVAKLLERTLGGHPEVDRAEALSVFRTHYADHCLDRTRPYPGVTTGLAALAARPGLRMAVVSNKPQALTEVVVRGLGLADHVGSIVGARSGVPVKPAPDLLRAALAELGTDASRPVVWMVGDSLNDVRSGQTLQAVTVAVTYGLTDEATLRAASPDLVVGSFDHVVDAALDAAGRSPS